MILPVGTATVHVSTRPHVGPAALIYFGGNAFAPATLNLKSKAKLKEGLRDDGRMFQPL